MFHLAYGRDADITSWPDPRTTHGPSYGPTYNGHTGVDARKDYDPYGSRVPLYAMSDGIVVAVSTEVNPDNRYASYQWSGISPAIRAGDKVWRISHMAECVVTVGQWVAKGQHVGFQGWTGTVDPPGPNGTHTHTCVFHDPDPSTGTPTLVDPVPYCTGMYAFPESPKPEETDMTNIPPIQYRYSNPPNGRLRDAPNGNIIGTVAVGQIVTVDQFATVNGYPWGHTPDGWVAVADQDGTPWVVQVFAVDTAEVDRLRMEASTLQGELDAHKAITAELTASEQALRGKLEQIKAIIG